MTTGTVIDRSSTSDLEGRLGDINDRVGHDPVGATGRTASPCVLGLLLRFALLGEGREIDGAVGVEASGTGWARGSGHATILAHALEVGRLGVPTEDLDQGFADLAHRGLGPHRVQHRRKQIAAAAGLANQIGQPISHQRAVPGGSPITQA